MRVRIGLIAVLLLVAVGLVSSASACEKCPADEWGVKRCSSGYTSGSQSCYGGSGTACTLDGTCGTAGGGGGGEVENPDYVVAVQPCLTCSGSEPIQGFVLQSADASADGSPQQRKVALPSRRR